MRPAEVSEVVFRNYCVPSTPRHQLDSRELRTDVEVERGAYLVKAGDNVLQCLLVAGR